MKKFKKLIPALCMLLVSAVMLGSTTFAWFSMNNTVTATGMEIKAEVPTQLLIKTDGDWGSTVAFAHKDGTMATTVVPVSASNLTKDQTLNGRFYKLTEAGMKKVNETGSLNGLTIGADYDYSTNTADFAETKVDYFADDFSLQLAGKLQTAAGKVTAKAVISSKDGTATSLDEITKALHIVITDKTGKVIINKDCGELGELTITAGASKELSLGDVHTFTTDNETKEFAVYVFYDGNDTDCKNANAVDISGLSISLEFKLGATA